MPETVQSYHAVIDSRETPHYPRQVYLELEGGKFMQIYFVDGDRESLGAVNPSGMIAQIYMPLRDFADVYQLLCTHKVVKAGWVADEQRKVTMVVIETPKGLAPGVRPT